ncbi:hypothetical protein NIGALANA_295 [Bacillus phage Nigalana]|uniref:Uncharacterized protein n=3 Tax=Wphvirus TaxID=1922327 RepID=A0A024B2A7_9CAUD|nr:hypothetical protein FP72_gp288 [Bacillus phage Hakuna]YP_009212232.1 hypothetical protein QLX47_gp292 [Bacillus phage Eyuki]YP_009279463.1 hypothetical protein BIZ89_gp296 [Bacillus phage Kida]YP_009282687.1 hypothetical protein BI005_gp295 [Bacillus phage Nigalana]YP_009285237.1 hypothetical protein BIZ88_gp295 [Bacillus phage DirtyBetty]AOZ62541.1 hypothetical protein SBP8a_291 [Bacillus phage SBP8a]ASR79123.1 hypothetical protein ZAINNY_296 [Bacillus phage Zainny]ULF49197.1 hypothetic
MRAKLYAGLEGIEKVKEVLTRACIQEEISMEQWTKINNHLENAHISVVRAINFDKSEE